MIIMAAVKYYMLGYDILTNRSIIADEQLVIQSVLLLLSTPKRSVPLRPNFGCDLDSLLFEPMHDTEYLSRLAQEYLVEALAYERRVAFDSCSVKIDHDRNQLVVILRIIIKLTGAQVDIYYPLDQSPVSEINSNLVS